jgi:hypothetical protein
MATTDKWQAIAYSGGIWDEVEAASYDEAYAKFQEIKRREQADDYQWIRRVEEKEENEK